MGYEIKTQEAEPPKRCLVQDLCKETGVHLALDGFIHLINLYYAPLLGAMCCPEDGDATVNKAGGGDPYLLELHLSGKTDTKT